MLKFGQYIIEMAALVSAGDRLDYEKRKYLDPHLPSGSMHGNFGLTMHSDYRTSSGKILTTGTRLNAHSLQTINNKRHIEVEAEDGSKHLVPANKIKKPRESKSGYSDEHAMVKVWNHFTDHGRENMNDENKMMQEIEKAKSDPSHPLSFEKASTEGFEGKQKHDLYRSHYYNELSHAARTISDMASHSKFKQHIENGERATHLGQSRGKLSSLYREAGVTDRSAVSKADMRIGDTNISLKQGDSNPTAITHHSEFKAAIRPIFTKGKKGLEKNPLVMRLKGKTAQVASPGPEEFKAMHYHVLLNKIGLNRDSEEFKSAKEKIDNIANIMKTGSADHKNKIAQINSQYSSLYNQYKDRGFGEHVTKEAAFGEGKFQTERNEKPVDYLVVTRRS